MLLLGCYERFSKDQRQYSGVVDEQFNIKNMVYNGALNKILLTRVKYYTLTTEQNSKSIILESTKETA